MHDANERPGDHLPWVRDNDLMPARSASAYARIAVEIEDDEAPSGPDPGDDLVEAAPTGPPPNPTTAVAAEGGPPSPNHRLPSPLAIESEPSGVGEPISVGPQPLATVFGLIALLALLLAGAALAITVAIVLLPSPARFGAAIVAAMLVGLLTYPALRWALLLSGFRRFRVESLEPLSSVRSATLQSVERRAKFQLRASVRTDGKESIRAKETLRRYLASHPIGKSRTGHRWSDLGISEDTLANLKRCRLELLRAGQKRAEKGGQPDEWIKSFSAGFLAMLDDLACRRVREHSWRTFKAVAASPNGGVDTLVTLVGGSAMIEDLGRIYNLRTGRIGAAVLLGRLLIDHDSEGIANLPEIPRQVDIAPAANEPGEVDEPLPEIGFRTILERHSMMSTGVEVDLLLARGAAQYGLRAKPALIHYFHTRKLGARAISVLEPLASR